MHLISLWAIGLAIVLQSGAHVVQNPGGQAPDRDGLERAGLFGRLKRMVNPHRQQLCREDDYYRFVNNSTFGQQFCQAYMKYPNNTITAYATPTVTTDGVYTTIEWTTITTVPYTPYTTTTITITDFAARALATPDTLLPRGMTQPQIKQAFQRFRQQHPAAAPAVMDRGSEASMSAAFSSACGCQPYGGPTITVTATDQPIIVTRPAHELSIVTITSTKTFATVTITSTVHVGGRSGIPLPSSESSSDNTTCLETSTSAPGPQPTSPSSSVVPLPITASNSTVLPPISSGVISTSPSPIHVTITSVTTISLATAPTVSSNGSITITSTETITDTSRLPGSSGDRSLESGSSTESPTTSTSTSSLNVTIISMPVVNNSLSVTTITSTVPVSHSSSKVETSSGHVTGTVIIPPISTSIVTVVSSGLTSISRYLGNSTAPFPTGVTSLQVPPSSSSQEARSGSEGPSSGAPSSGLLPLPTANFTTSIRTHYPSSSSNAPRSGTEMSSPVTPTTYPGITTTITIKTSLPSTGPPSYPTNGSSTFIGSSGFPLSSPISFTSLPRSGPSIDTTTSTPFSSFLSSPSLPPRLSTLIPPVNISSVPSYSSPFNSSIAVSPVASSLPTSTFPSTHTSTPWNSTLTPRPTPGSTGTGVSSSSTSYGTDTFTSNPRSIFTLPDTTGSSAVSTGFFPTGHPRNATSVPFPIPSCTGGGKPVVLTTTETATLTATVTEEIATFIPPETVTTTVTEVGTFVTTETETEKETITSVRTVTTTPLSCAGHTTTVSAPHYLAGTGA